MGLDGATRGRLLPLPLAQARFLPASVSLPSQVTERLMRFSVCDTKNRASHPVRAPTGTHFACFLPIFRGQEDMPREEKSSRKQVAGTMKPQSANFAMWPATPLSKLKGKSCRRAVDTSACRPAPEAASEGSCRAAWHAAISKHQQLLAAPCKESCLCLIRMTTTRHAFKGQVVLYL